MLKKMRKEKFSGRFTEQKLWEKMRAAHTELENKNRALAEVVLRQQEVIDFLPDATLAIDNSGKITIWNRALEQVTGISTESMLGKANYEYALPLYGVRRPALLDLLLNPNKEIEAAYDYIQRDGDRVTAEAEVTLRGERRIIWIVAQLLYDTAGRVAGAVESLRDITERKQAAEALRQARDQLEIKVEERTQELIRANADLTKTIDELKRMQEYLVQAEKMAALGELVAGVAHEINTPVGVSLTASSYLTEETRQFTAICKAGTVRRQDLTRYLETIEQSTGMIQMNLERAAKLIQSFKQVSVDQASEAQRIFNLKKYLEEILLSLHSKTKKTKHHIVVDCEEKLSINGFPGAFAQVVTNLVMNSLVHAYGPEDEGNILLQVRREDGQIRFTYADDGAGMTEEVRDRVFDPFFTTKRGAGGSGLGLYTVYNIVTKKFGGTIDCDSAPGKGVTFNIRIPVELALGAQGNH